MNGMVPHSQQECDPSSLNQQSQYQFANYYSYSYPYPNPQFTTTDHLYTYQNPLVQPSQHEQQEPNPPGVPPPPPSETFQNPYYQYHHTYAGPAAVPIAGPPPVAVDSSVHTVVHQPIVQPLYGGVGILDATVPRGDHQTHLVPQLNVPNCSFLVDGHGGQALPMNAAPPFHDQTVTSYGGVHIQGGPYQLPSQSYGETHHGPKARVSGRTNRGRGRGKGSVHRKHAVAPTQDLKLGTSSVSQTLVPLQVPAQLVSVPPTQKAVSCELCKVECNTLEILQQHVSGKKHQKKLKVFEELQNLNKKVISGQAEQKLTAEVKSEAVSEPARVEVSDNKQLQKEVLPSQEITEGSKVAGEKRKVEEVEPPKEPAKKTKADAESRRRVSKHKPKGGKSNKKMRPSGRSKSLVQLPKPKEAAVPLVCELCNVKCESLVVFQSHLAGKKHIAKAKRFLGQETFGHELAQPHRPAVQAVTQSIGSAPNYISFQQGYGAYHHHHHHHQVASAQNVNTGAVEAISQSQPLVANSGASFAGATWNETGAGMAGPAGS